MTQHQNEPHSRRKIKRNSARSGDFFKHKKNKKPFYWCVPGTKDIMSEHCTHEWLSFLAGNALSVPIAQSQP